MGTFKERLKKIKQTSTRNFKNTVLPTSRCDWLIGDKLRITPKDTRKAGVSENIKGKVNVKDYST